MLLSKYYFGYQIKNSGLGGLHNTYGGTGEVHTGFWRRCEGNVDMTLQEVELKAWNVLMWLGWEQVAGCCECGNEPSGSINVGNILTS